MSVEKSQQTKNSVEQKNISVNKEKKSFWEKSQKLLSNKEIYKQLFKTGVGTFASIKGVKSFYDVPAYFKQKFEAHENKKEFKEIMSELNKEGIDKENIKDKKVGEIIDFKVMDEMQNKIEGLDVNEEIKNKLTEELNIMIENYRDEMEDLEAQENETLEEVLDEYIRTKITGVQVSKEVLNTFFVGSAVANPTLAPAAYLSRSLSYGFMDGVNRYLRLRKNAERKDKNTSIKEEDVGIIKDVIINGIKETFQDAILKSNSRIEKTGKQKAMDFIKAWGKIVKYTFIGAKVEFNSESLSKSFERSLDAFEGRNNLSLSEMGSNVTKNIEGIPSRYWNIIKKPFNWFHSDIEKSGEIGGKEEPEAANATNVTKFAAEDSSNETEIKHPKITELIPKNATENSVTTSGISLEDKNLWQELADKDQTLADKWKKFLNEHPKYLLTYKKVLDDGLNSGEEEDFTKMLKEMKSTGMSQMDAREIFLNSAGTGKTGISNFITDNFGDITDIKNKIETTGTVENRESHETSVSQESAGKIKNISDNGTLSTGEIFSNDKANRIVESYLKENSISNPSKISKEQFSEVLEKLEKERIEHYTALVFLKDKLGNNFGEERGLRNEFTLKLGQGKVPSQLERVFHMMSVDSMKDIMGDDQIFSEEEGAKSLNVAANLVKLAEGENVGGVNANEFRKAIEWNVDTNELIIRDHTKFNEIVGELNKHAQELWNDQILQKEEVSYLDDIRKNTWEDIIKANGLEHKVEGHDEITSDKIMDFKNSEMVGKANKVIESMKDSKELEILSGADSSSSDDIPIIESEEESKFFKESSPAKQWEKIQELREQKEAISTAEDVQKVLQPDNDKNISLLHREYDIIYNKENALKTLYYEQNKSLIDNYDNLEKKINELSKQADEQAQKSLLNRAIKIYKKFFGGWDKNKWATDQGLEVDKILEGKNHNIVNKKLLNYIKEAQSVIGNPEKHQRIGDYLAEYEKNKAEKFLGLGETEKKLKILNRALGWEKGEKPEESGKMIIEDVPGILKN